MQTLDITFTFSSFSTSPIINTAPTRHHFNQALHLNTAIMASHAAANQVFDTVELEMILLNLTWSTLLTSQGVNKTFQTTILRSPKIQGTFYFKPPAQADRLKSTHLVPPGMSAALGDIVTPEGYHLDIRRYTCGNVTFYIGGDELPSLARPAMGSWRRMHLAVSILGRSTYLFRIADWETKTLYWMNAQKGD